MEVPDGETKIGAMHVPVFRYVLVGPRLQDAVRGLQMVGLKAAATSLEGQFRVRGEMLVAMAIVSIYR